MDYFSKIRKWGGALERRNDGKLVGYDWPEKRGS